MLSTWLASRVTSGRAGQVSVKHRRQRAVSGVSSYCTVHTVHTQSRDGAKLITVTVHLSMLAGHQAFAVADNDSTGQVRCSVDSLAEALIRGSSRGLARSAAGVLSKYMTLKVTCLSSRPAQPAQATIVTQTLVGPCQQRCSPSNTTMQHSP